MKKLSILLPAIIFIFSCGNDEKKNEAESVTEEKIDPALSYEERERREMEEMQKNQPKVNPYKDAAIEVRVFKNDTIKQDIKYSGYGYDIIINGQTYNHQPHKPGVPGINGFKSAEDAKKTGGLVAYKVRNNIMPPSITAEELDSLGTLR